MTRKEKAIIVSMIANGCEFRKEMAIINNKEYEIDEFNRIVELADEALEKQIPQKPKGDYHSCPHYRCPNCNSSVKMYETDNTYPHCAFCGQKLDLGGANG